MQFLSFIRYYRYDNLYEQTRYLLVVSAMPIYTYRREDGTTFDIRQKFLDDALENCPTTGQKVSRVIQPAGIIFKGSGFYVNDNSKATNPAAPAKKDESSASGSDAPKSEAKSETKSETKSEAKKESKTPSPAAD